MLVIWSGWSALTIIIVAVVTMAVGMIVQLTLGALGYPQFAFLAASIGLGTAAAANWMIGRRMNAAPPRALLDTATGERVVLTRTHRLFWIRMEYWSIPVALRTLVPLLALPGALRS